MVHGETSTGFMFSVDKNAMNDMEVVDAIAQVGSDVDYEKISGLSILCAKFLGKDKKRLYDHLRTEDGRVPVEAIEKELNDIFSAIGDKAKN